MEGLDAARNGSTNGNGSSNGHRQQNGQFARNGSDGGDTAELEGAGFEVNERFVTAPANTEETRVEALEERVERLSFICEAMWNLMSEELGLDLGRLTAKLAEIGSPDSSPAEGDTEDDTVCPNCGNAKPAEAELCLFCSAGAR